MQPELLKAAFILVTAIVFLLINSNSRELVKKFISSIINKIYNKKIVKLASKESVIN